jgi:type I restriction enzyme S subunit
MEIVDKKNMLVPKLRFKEFDGEWKKSNLGSFANVSKLAGYEFTKHIVYQDEGKIIALRALNIKNNSLDLKDVKYIDNSELSMLSRSKLYIDDLMFTYIGTIGEVAIINDNDRFYLAPNVARIRLSKEKVVAKFICQYFNVSKFKNIEIKKHIATSSQPSLTMENVRKFELNIPSLPEQQKIASFLSAVDEKIQQLSRKKELLEQYKKGVMQQLFSGKLRFKDDNGKDFPDWEEKMLGEIGYTFNGLTGKTKENFGDGKRYIQYMQIFANSKIDISKCGLVQIAKNENQQRVQYGDVFFTTSSETPNEIGTCSVLLDEIGELYLNSFCFGYRPNSLKQLFPQFAQYLFRNEIFRRKIIKLAQGSTRYNMSKVELMKLKVILPSLQEQQKIANFLSGIDSKIESVAKQITQVQNFKKGLLQQMFV